MWNTTRTFYFTIRWIWTAFSSLLLLSRRVTTVWSTPHVLKFGATRSQGDFPSSWVQAKILTVLVLSSLKLFGTVNGTSGPLSTLCTRHQPLRSTSLIADAFANWMYFPSKEHSSIQTAPNRKIVYNTCRLESKPLAAFWTVCLGFVSLRSIWPKFNIEQKMREIDFTATTNFDRWTPSWRGRSWRWRLKSILKARFWIHWTSYLALR